MSSIFQLFLGKYYLSLADTEEESSKSSTEAVQWLCKASRLGNDEATELLDGCLQRNQGTGNSAKKVEFVVHILLPL